jgi:hypothetical protein
MNRNLVGCIIGRSSIKIAHLFVNGSGRNEKFYRGHAIDASYQVSLDLAEGFQRRRLKCEKLTDDGCQVMDWLISKKSSLKSLGQMNRNLVGCIIGRSSIKIAHLVPIR